MTKAEPTLLDDLQTHSEIDYLYFCLSQLEKDLTKSQNRAPIVRMVDEACGYDPLTPIMLEMLNVIKMINQRKKKLGMDVSESEKRWKEMKKKLKELGRKEP